MTIRQKTWNLIAALIKPEMDVLLKGVPLKYAFLETAPQIDFWLTLDDTKPKGRRNVWFIDLNLALPAWLRAEVREDIAIRKRREMEENMQGESPCRELFEKKLTAAVSKEMGKFSGRFENRTTTRDEQNICFLLCYGLESNRGNDANQKNVRRYIYHALMNNPHSAVAHEGKGHNHVTRWIAQNAVTWENTPALISDTEAPQEVIEALYSELREMICCMAEVVNSLRKHLDNHGTLLDSGDEKIKDSVASSLASLLGIQELESRAHNYWHALAGDAAAYPGESASFQSLYMALPSARRESFCRAIVFDKSE